MVFVVTIMYPHLSLVLRGLSICFYFLSSSLVEGIDYLRFLSFSLCGNKNFMNITFKYCLKNSKNLIKDWQFAKIIKIAFIALYVIKFCIKIKYILIIRTMPTSYRVGCLHVMNCQCIHSFRHALIQSHSLLSIHSHIHSFIDSVQSSRLQTIFANMRFWQRH